MDILVVLLGLFFVCILLILGFRSAYVILEFLSGTISSADILSQINDFSGFLYGLITSVIWSFWSLVCLRVWLWEGPPIFYF